MPVVPPTIATFLFCISTMVLIISERSVRKLRIMDSGTKRSVGRPRSESARRAILDAAFALAAEEGAAGMTMEAVARRAGVSKETLYRWWRSRVDVLLDALAGRGEREIPVPRGDDLAAALGAPAAQEVARA
jgi:AcrR family transcriptional regulator